MTPAQVLIALLCIGQMPFMSAFALDLLKDYSGATFFDEWDFFGGWDNLTLGDVNWVDKSNATSEKLAFINGGGNAILKVDNTTNVVWQNKRDSVRITTRKVYPIGTVWVADIVHMPFGCSVWPALWTKGPLWPADGEIDIIEGINLMQNNQIALHTQPGCNHSSPAPANQRGLSDQLDCGSVAGCTVQDTVPNSFGAGFNSAGGGVFATHFDASSIRVWFWSRPNIPPSIRKTTPTSALSSLDDWGPPAANFPSGTHCNITNYFGSQSLVLDITLCGTWAGAPSIYSPQCSNQGKTGKCYDDNVVGTGEKYNEAYFEIKYIRAYGNTASLANVNAKAPTTKSTGGKSVVTATPKPKKSSATTFIFAAAPKTFWGAIGALFAALAF